MAGPSWLPSSSPAIAESFARLDHLLSPLQAKRTMDLADLRATVARLDGSDDAPGRASSPPQGRRERPGESHRSSAAESARPFVPIPRGDFGPAVIEKLTREALAKERRW